jgi:NAD kinase
MKLKKVLVVYKDSILEEHRKTMDGLRKILNAYDIKSTFLRRNELDKECAQDCDLILSVGGDGTLLRVSHFVNDTAVLGVNSNTKTSEGILCYATRHDLKEKLARIIDGKFAIKKLTRARVFFINAGRNYDALNEIYVGSATPYHTSRYILKFGRLRGEQKSSGIIIATGAGSTAWYGSVVKESFNPEMKELRFIVREPYRGKLLNFNLTKGKLKATRKLYIKSKMLNGIVAADSIVETPFRNEEEIEVSISPEPLMLISFVKKD